MADATTYDLSIGAHNFFMAATPERPYIRQTAPYRKDQNDNSAEPGEQTLQGWWYRSQSSFHLGCGIKYYEPQQDDTLRYRFAMSDGVNVWTKGQVSLLSSTAKGHTITGMVGLGSAGTRVRSLPASYNAILALDGQDVDKILSDGTATHFVDFNGGASEPVLAVCDDGKYAYFICNQASPTKWHLFRKPLTGDSTTGDTTPSGDVIQLYQATTNALSAEIEWCFGRLIIAVRTSTGTEIFQGAVDTAAGTVTLTSIYVNKGSNIVRRITASDSHIFVAMNQENGGGGGEILRITVDGTGVISALSGAVTVAKMPNNEGILSIKHYLGYILIGTTIGMRVAQVSAAGDLTYGPNILEDAYNSQSDTYGTAKPFVWDFAVKGTFAYAASRVPVLVDSTGQSSLRMAAGVWRVDLTTQIEPLRFPYAADLRSSVSSIAGYYATGVGFASGENMIFASWEPTVGGVGGFYYEIPSTKVESGCIVTGRIRFNTLEKKIFRSFVDRSEYVTGSTLDLDEIQFDNVTGVNYPRVEGLTLTSTTGGTENTLPTSTAAEWKQYRITLTRGTSNLAKGTVLNGYQIKALPASPRQRLIQYPVYCFDTEIDKYNIAYGYDGKAYSTLTALEATEGTGAIVTVTDRRTGETFPGMIEEVTFRSETPPDKRFNGFGGILTVTVRKI